MTDPVAAPYHTGEVVLAHTHSQLYKAKVLKVQENRGEFSFFLHFNGWSKKWDEWVEAKRVYKMTEENLQKAKDLKKKKPVKTKANKNGGKKRKRGEEDEADANTATVTDDTLVDDTQAGSSSSKRMTLRIPGPLKKCLIMDWENITRHNKLLRLPRPYTVSTVLQEYLGQKTQSPENLELNTEVTVGLRRYFEHALPSILLYKLEREQYEQLVSEHEIGQGEEDVGTKAALADFYGVEHLARLFVKLPELLASTKMGTEERKTLQVKVLELMKWLAKRSHYFNKDYILNVTEETEEGCV